MSVVSGGVDMERTEPKFKVGEKVLCTVPTIHTGSSDMVERRNLIFTITSVEYDENYRAFEKTWRYHVKENTNYSLIEEILNKVPRDTCLICINACKNDEKCPFYREA